MLSRASTFHPLRSPRSNTEDQFPCSSLWSPLRCVPLSWSRCRRLDLHGARFAREQGKRRSLSSIRNTGAHSSYLEIEKGDRVDWLSRAYLNGRFRIMRCCTITSDVFFSFFLSCVFPFTRGLVFLSRLLYVGSIYSALSLEGNQIGNSHAVQTADFHASSVALL